MWDLSLCVAIALLPLSAVAAPSRQQFRVELAERQLLIASCDPVTDQDEV